MFRPWEVVDTRHGQLYDGAPGRRFFTRRGARAYRARINRRLNPLPGYRLVVRRRDRG